MGNHWTAMIKKILTLLGLIFVLASAKAQVVTYTDFNMNVSVGSFTSLGGSSYQGAIGVIGSSDYILDSLKVGYTFYASGSDAQYTITADSVVSANLVHIITVNDVDGAGAPLTGRGAVYRPTTNYNLALIPPNGDDWITEGDESVLLTNNFVRLDSLIGIIAVGGSDTIYVDSSGVVTAYTNGDTLYLPTANGGVDSMWTINDSLFIRDISFGTLAVDLDTFKQTLTENLIGTVYDVTISNGNTIQIDVADNDNSIANELQSVSELYIQSDSLFVGLVSDGVDPSKVDLSGFLDNTDTSGYQNLTYVPATGIINISTGTGDTIAVYSGSSYLGAGVRGLVPDATIGDSLFFLRGDGTWGNPSVGGDNWGAQVVQTTGTLLSGDGTGGDPLLVNDSLSNYVNDAGFLTVEVDGSITNEAWTIDADAGDIEQISNQTVIIRGTGIATTNYTDATNTLTIDATEVDGAVTNEGSLSVNAGTTSNSIIRSNTSGSTGVILEQGVGIDVSESDSTITITNASPDQVVSMTEGDNITITGTYPTFTITGKPASYYLLASDFGADTSLADNGPQFQALYDSAKANGYPMLIDRPGVYKCETSAFDDNGDAAWDIAIHAVEGVILEMRDSSEQIIRLKNEDLSGTYSLSATSEQTRNSLQLILNTTAGLDEGDIIAIQSDSSVTGISEKKNDILEIDYVVDDTTVQLKDSLLFTYAAGEGIDIFRVYKKHSLDIKNINIRVREDISTTGSTVNTIQGFNNVTIEDFSVINDTFPNRQVIDAMSITNCANVYTNRLRFESLRYGILVNRGLKYYLHETQIEHSRHFAAFSTFSRDMVVDGLYGWANRTPIEAHCAYNVTFRNVESYQTDDINVRAFGNIVLDNVYVRSDATDAGGSSYSLIGYHFARTDLDTAFMYLVDNTHIRINETTYLSDNGGKFRGLTACSFQTYTATESISDKFGAYENTNEAENIQVVIENCTMGSLQLNGSGDDYVNVTNSTFDPTLFPNSQDQESGFDVLIRAENGSATTVELTDCEIKNTGDSTVLVGTWNLGLFNIQLNNVETDTFIGWAAKYTGAGSISSYENKLRLNNTDIVFLQNVVPDSVETAGGGYVYNPDFSRASQVKNGSTLTYGDTEIKGFYRDDYEDEYVFEMEGTNDVKIGTDDGSGPSGNIVNGIFFERGSGGFVGWVGNSGSDDIEFRSRDDFWFYTNNDQVLRMNGGTTGDNYILSKIGDGNSISNDPTYLAGYSGSGVLKEWRANTLDDANLSAINNKYLIIGEATGTGHEKISIDSLWTTRSQMDGDTITGLNLGNSYSTGSDTVATIYERFDTTFLVYNNRSNQIEYMIEDTTFNGGAALNNPPQLMNTADGFGIDRRPRNHTWPNAFMQTFIDESPYNRAFMLSAGRGGITFKDSLGVDPYRDTLGSYITEASAAHETFNHYDYVFMGIAPSEDEETFGVIYNWIEWLRDTMGVVDSTTIYVFQEAPYELGSGRNWNSLIRHYVDKEPQWRLVTYAYEQDSDDNVHLNATQNHWQGVYAYGTVKGERDVRDNRRYSLDGNISLGKQSWENLQAGTGNVNMMPGTIDMTIVDSLHGVFLWTGGDSITVDNWLKDVVVMGGGNFSGLSTIAPATNLYVIGHDNLTNVNILRDSQIVIGWNNNTADNVGMWVIGGSYNETNNNSWVDVVATDGFTGSALGDKALFYGRNARDIYFGDSLIFDADISTTAVQDEFVLTYDHDIERIVLKVAPGAGGGMTSWTIAGDSGSESVSDGQIATIAGGEGISTIEDGTRQVTVNTDDTNITGGTIIPYWDDSDWQDSGMRLDTDTIKFSNSIEDVHFENTGNVEFESSVDDILLTNSGIVTITGLSTDNAATTLLGVVGDSIVSIDASTYTYTADNGLTMTGTEVELGGTLNQTTTILGDGEVFSFINMGQGTFNSDGNLTMSVDVGDASTGNIITISNGSAFARINSTDGFDEETWEVTLDSSQHVLTEGALLIIDSNADGTDNMFEIGANASSTAGGAYNMIAQFREGAIHFNDDIMPFNNSLDTMIVIDPATGELYLRDVPAGGGGGSLTVEESDGSPSVSSVTTLEFNQAEGLIIVDEGSGVVRVEVSGENIAVNTDLETDDMEFLVYDNTNDNMEKVETDDLRTWMYSDWVYRDGDVVGDETTYTEFYRDTIEAGAFTTANRETYVLETLTRYVNETATEFWDFRIQIDDGSSTQTAGEHTNLLRLTAGDDVVAPFNVRIMQDPDGSEDIAVAFVNGYSANVYSPGSLITVDDKEGELIVILQYRTANDNGDTGIEVIQGRARVEN